jgi:hypothetical protein
MMARAGVEGVDGGRYGIGYRQMDGSEQGRRREGKEGVVLLRVGVRSSLMAEGRFSGGRVWGRGPYGPYGLRVEVNYGWRGLAKSLPWDYG